MHQATHRAETSRVNCTGEQTKTDRHGSSGFCRGMILVYLQSMAVFWQKTIQGVRYEIRSAGATLRLYTDGVFHSQYNPNQALTGGIWDLLMLPALFYHPGQIRRVLVLGVGGGAVIRLLTTYAEPETIVGVEMSEQHLKLARRFFGIKGKHIHLLQAEAVDWLRRYQGPPFDIIIDDLFTEHEGEPLRAVPLDHQWFGLLTDHLTQHGVIVVNTVSRQELKRSAYMTNRSVARQFSTAYSLTLPTYENTIAAFFRQSMPRKRLADRIASIPENRARNALHKLPYRLRALKPG